MEEGYTVQVFIQVVRVLYSIFHTVMLSPSSSMLLRIAPSREKDKNPLLYRKYIGTLRNTNLRPNDRSLRKYSRSYLARICGMHTRGVHVLSTADSKTRYSTTKYQHTPSMNFAPDQKRDCCRYQHSQDRTDDACLYSTVLYCTHSTLHTYPHILRKHMESSAVQ